MLDLLNTEIKFSDLSSKYYALSNQNIIEISRNITQFVFEYNTFKNPTIRVTSFNFGIVLKTENL